MKRDMEKWQGDEQRLLKRSEKPILEKRAGWMSLDNMRMAKGTGMKTKAVARHAPPARWKK